MARFQNMEIIKSPYPGLGSHGLQAIEHWQRFLPKMAAALEAAGELGEAAKRAEDQTFEEQLEIEQDLRRQGYTAEQAYQAAWEIVRERYIFLPPEEGYDVTAE